MPPGRNDPCPCGSGRKYKHCCAHTDAAASPTLRLLGHDTHSEMRSMALAATRQPVQWEADVTPITAHITSEPSARPAAVMVVAGEIVLHSDIVMHPPSSADGVAALLKTAVDALLAQGCKPPSSVLVRHAEVAAALTPLLRPATTTRVEFSPRLVKLDEFAVGLRRHMSGLPDAIPAVSNPDMWAAWNLPPATLHDLFSAAAAFYLAAPWKLLQNADILELMLPSGARWFGVVLGAGGEEFGLGLYERFEDFLALVEAPDHIAGFATQESVVLSLTFDKRADLPKPMRQEITNAAWPIAGPSAYPSLWALNTIGGGLSDSHAHDLVVALAAVARFSTALASAGADIFDHLDELWTDPVSGTTVGFAVTPEEEMEPLWEIPMQLSASLAEGRIADPTDRLRDGDADEPASARDDALAARFAAHMRTTGVAEQRVIQDKGNIDLFVNVMRGEQGVHLPAVTELDLRVFLYDILPRKTRCPKSMANAIRASLKRFFAYLAAHEELAYPWANAILRDKAAFEERWDSFGDGHWWDEGVVEWLREFYDDLRARIMLPSPALAGVGEWGETMGYEEAQLFDTLQRKWLVWRDAEILRGHTTPLDLVERLMKRQAEWEQGPTAGPKGPSPSKVIAAERRRRQ